MSKKTKLKSQKPREKNVIILIEGKSERTTFELALPELFDQIADDYRVHFPVIFEDEKEKGGDITSKYGITPLTIIGCINKLFISKVLDETKIYARDIAEIIHIIDLDGAYIPDDNIRCGTNPNGEDKAYYAADSILTDDVQKITNRNQRKRENIEALLALPNGKIRVWQNPENPKSKQYEVPYSIYYFSSNLDHFIHNDANIPSGLSKVQLAEAFRNGYIDDINGFIDFFMTDPNSAGEMSYSQSWAYIQQRNLNSLTRRTNVDILLKRLITVAQENK